MKIPFPLHYYYYLLVVLMWMWGMMWRVVLHSPAPRRHSVPNSFYDPVGMTVVVTFLVIPMVSVLWLWLVVVLLRMIQPYYQYQYATMSRDDDAHFQWRY